MATTCGLYGRIMAMLDPSIRERWGWARSSFRVLSGNLRPIRFHTFSQRQASSMVMQESATRHSTIHRAPCTSRSSPSAATRKHLSPVRRMRSWVFARTRQEASARLRPSCRRWASRISLSYACVSKTRKRERASRVSSPAPWATSPHTRSGTCIGPRWERRGGWRRPGSPPSSGHLLEPSRSLAVRLPQGEPQDLRRPGKGEPALGQGGKDQPFQARGCGRTF